jgi:glycerophosphodiester phosphodiesterase
LAVVLANRRNRRDIFFSSFHPSICVALALKQNEIPVLFIVCNEEDFSDTRTKNVDSGLAFAKSVGLSGLVTYAPNFLESPERILQDSREKNLALLTYTSGNATVDEIKV